MPSSVPAYCLHCLRPVTLDFEVPSDLPKQHQGKWTCPYPDCNGDNDVKRMVVTHATPRVISSERRAQDRKQSD